LEDFNILPYTTVQAYALRAGFYHGISCILL